MFAVTRRLLFSAARLAVGRPRSWDPPLYYSWSRLVRKFKLPSMENIRQFPNVFYTVHTEHGWTAVPLALYCPGWTKRQLGEVFAGADTPPTTVEARQRLVCAWAQRVDLSTPPVAEITTEHEEPQSAEDKLYQQQLGYAQNTPADGLAKPRRITNTNAWNYFNSMRFRELKGAHTVAEARQIIKLEWEAFDWKQKKQYLAKYVDLLEQGYVLKRGEIVSLEESEAPKKPRQRKPRNKAKAEKL